MTIYCGDIGSEPRTYEFEPLEEPASRPASVPPPVPAEPVRVPEPVGAP